jgi:hypothetical protein
LTLTDLIELNIGLIIPLALQGCVTSIRHRHESFHQAYPLSLLGKIDCLFRQVTNYNGSALGEAQELLCFLLGVGDVSFLELNLESSPLNINLDPFLDYHIYLADGKLVYLLPFLGPDPPLEEVPDYFLLLLINPFLGLFAKDAVGPDDFLLEDSLDLLLNF